MRPNARPVCTILTVGDTRTRPTAPEVSRGGKYNRGTDHCRRKTPTMVTLSVRHVPDAVYRALRIRADNHGRSTEAEVLAILEEVVARSPERARLGSVLAGESDEEDREDSEPGDPR